MDDFFTVSARQGGTLQQNPSLIISDRRKNDNYFSIAYGVALLVSIWIWFIAARAPLWLDETGSYWIISKGFSQIWSRGYPSLTFPVYECILWFGSKIFGASELGLRMPSLIAMLSAAYLLYLAARVLFEREIAFIATIVFCLNPMIAFAAADVRPYAFGMLATNAAILCLVRLRRSESMWLAALFGLTSALILYFHFLMGVILPALLICFFVAKAGNRRGQWRQLGFALIVFAAAMLPVIPSILFMFHSPESHVFEGAPRVQDLLVTFAPVNFLPTQGSVAIFFYVTLSGTLVVAAMVTGGLVKRSKPEIWKIFVCLSLALIPALILYGVSVGTSIHIFAIRHRIEAVSGIAFCMALFFSLVKNRSVRLFFCLVLVVTAAYQGFTSNWQHLYSWKGALAVAEQNASVDNAPVLICSDFPESDYATMPVDSAKESQYFSQLSYYKLSVPVVPLPRALNNEAMMVASGFFQFAATNHQRFLALGYFPSYRTLDWLAGSAEAQYSVRVVGNYDGVLVLEFTPRAGAAAW